MKSTKPNLLIFMTDQQQDAVLDGDHPCRMPQLEKLISEGVRFDRTYTTMAHCCPSRASFMTGLYPSQHGIYNNVSNRAAIRRTLQPGVTTFSESLKEHGYSLHYSGKWHVSAEENPEDRGWEELKVVAGKGKAMGVPIEEWRKKSANVPTGERQEGILQRPGWGDYRLYGSFQGELEQTEDYETVALAADRIESLKDSDQPWCVYVGTTGPHDPFVIPAKYAEMYDPETISLPPNYGDSLEGKPGVYRRMRKLWDQLSEREVRASIAHYWGYCTMIDDLLGHVLNALERSGQKEDTLVLFLSDHGESLGAHGLYLKGISPYEETYRIPCAIRWPAVIERPGRTVSKLVSMIDFAPTLLEAAGINDPGDLPGNSLMHWLKGEEPVTWRDAVFTQCNGVEVYYTQRMVITERFKWVYNPLDLDELYDLELDPFEMNNLAESPEMKQVKDKLILRMWQEAAEADDIIFNPYPTVASSHIGPAQAIGSQGSE